MEELRIVDGQREAVRPDERPLWRPPEQAAGTPSAAGLVIPTGSALVEGGVDALLAAAHAARRVGPAGPTAWSWLRMFFAGGVDVLGGIRVLELEKLLRSVAEGGSCYFFADAAEKVCVVRQGR